ncbi:MAG: hypothetical protein JXB19_09290 [Bacteroidales bacterium]|nr:hypothetical protein [Bacteroidales bacterium]
MKEITILLLSPWKFAATFPLAILVFKMSWTDTIIFTNIGGIAGIIIFGLLSRLLIFLWDRYWPDTLKFNRGKRKIHTKRNRLIVRLKNQYGLSGIVVLSPVLLSIPVGSYLITKYYGRNMMNYFWQFLGQFAWSVIYIVFFVYFQNIL